MIRWRPPRRGVKITATKAMQLRDLRTLIKIETDAGISGYGECPADDHPLPR